MKCIIDSVTPDSVYSHWEVEGYYEECSTENVIRYKLFGVFVEEHYEFVVDRLELEVYSGVWVVVDYYRMTKVFNLDFEREVCKHCEQVSKDTSLISY